MLHELLNTITWKAKTASTAGISPLHYYLYHAGEGSYDTSEARELVREYERATITLPYADIAQLDAKSFFDLQWVLHESVFGSSEVLTRFQLRRIADFVQPGSKKNVISHESDHIKVLADEVKQRASVDVTFIREDPMSMGINGSAMFDFDQVPPRDLALSYSEPQSLSEDDIREARYFAKLTEDKSFQTGIEKRISLRSRH